jgi:hypothetical protein
MGRPLAQGKERHISWLAGLLIFLLALIPRLHAAWLGFVTPDEPSWVYRSVRFLQAIDARHWADTMQTGHPGAITMWIGSLGILWERWRDPRGATDLIDWIDNVPWVTPENVALFRHLAPFLPPARVSMAVLTSAGIVLVYVFAYRLWGRRVAVLGAALIALDPFAVALSGLLHLDAPAMTLMTPALLAWLVALDERGATSRWRPAYYAMISGLLTGLGILAKGPAVLVVPVIALSALWHLLSAHPTWSRAGRIALLGAAWLPSATVGLIGPFPAMWVDPRSVLERIFGMSGSYFDAPLHLQYFRGSVTADPGALFYGTVLLYRTTPITLIGLLLSPLSLLAGRSRAAGPHGAQTASLWALVLGFGALLTLGGQKFDRYLLPVFPAVDLLAAIGWTTVIRAIQQYLSRRGRQMPFVGTLLALVAIQGAMILPSWPYYLDVYNPLLGGLAAARRTLSVGWGEGMEQIAAWLDRQPDAPEQVIAVTSPVLIGSLVDGPVVPLDDTSRTLADKIVITTSDRQFDPATVNELTSDARLDSVVHIGGEEALWLYATQLDAEREYLDRHGKAGDLILCDAPSPFARRPGNWDVYLVEEGDEGRIAAELNGWSTGHARLWYLSYPTASPITASILRRQLETFAMRLERIDLGYASATLYGLPGGPAFEATEDAFQTASFGGEIALADGMLLESDLIQQRTVRFRLRWQSIATPQADYAPFIHLFDEQDHLRSAGRGLELLVDDRFWATSHWSVGESVEADYSLSLPPGLPPGRYWIAIGLANATGGGRVPVLDEEGQVRGTTAKVFPIDVPPPQVPPDPGALQLLNPVRIQWGTQIRLLGYEHPSRASVGQKIVVELIWQGLEPFGGDDAVRLALVDSGGTVAYRGTYPLSPYPTSRWRPGELIHALYDLELPPDLEGGTYRLRVDALDQHGEPRGEPAELGSIDITSQERTFELLQPPQHRLALRVGEGILLLGYDLPQTEIPLGKDVALTLYWQCQAPVEQSYTVFVHLLDGNGQVQGQQDSPPLSGRAPTSGWVPGQIVVDTYAIPMSALAVPGPYRIEVGMYDPQDITRLPIVNADGERLADDRVLLPTEITVTGP